MTVKLTPWTQEIIIKELNTHAVVHAALGIDAAFMEKLISTSEDLQFLVTLAVIVEGATAEALRRKISNNVVFDWVLDNVRSHAARLQLAKNLNLIQDETFKSLKKLAEIRNQYAHGSHNLKKTLVDFYNSQEQSRKDSIISAFANFLIEPHQPGPYDDSCFKSNFRGALLTATMVPLFELSAAIAGK